MLLLVKCYDKKGVVTLQLGHLSFDNPQVATQQKKRYVFTTLLLIDVLYSNSICNLKYCKNFFSGLPHRPHTRSSTIPTGTLTNTTFGIRTTQTLKQMDLGFPFFLTY